MKYKKKPIVIEAMQWNDFNLDEVLRFLGVNGTLKSRDTILIVYFRRNYESFYR